VRLVLDVADDPWLVPAAALAGLLLVLAALFAFRQRLFAAALVVVALALGAAAALRPLAVQAFPTSFAQAPVTYHAGSIATGARLYRERCATCHEAGGAVDLRSDAVRQRTAGELFWLIGHGHGPSAPDLDEARRWDLVNFIRAMDAASDPRAIGPKVEPDDGWLVAPDFTIAVGPLAPRSLRDFRGARMVLLVLYDLPASRDRMTELARRSGTLSVLGVEVVAVSPRSSPAAIGALGSNPPAYFPVVTAGNEDIASTYRLFAPGTAHAELLIDRQGYIRAIWRSDATGMPDAAAVQAEVERLNAEKAPPPLPDDHVH
jgi:mono/diheme cytochrome c family protein/peroxiredoxin